ncbi:GNAT family N-acetyltransferase [Paucibacter sp. O1-1]|nr:GNAT family N-acetyltransferase [Paucibacter sp. O1-1]MDA3830918.1 GNAT family N-acetyltransferase [Paucibacter sp. O1-1]
MRLHLDKDVQQYIRPVDAEDNLKKNFVQRNRPYQFESGQWLSLVIERLDNQQFVVGLIGFRCDDLALKRAEVGYLIAPEQQGNGYATESLRAVIDWGALQFEMHKYIAICCYENLASRKVLENVGFVQERGRWRQNTCINQQWFDDCYFGLLTT